MHLQHRRKTSNAVRLGPYIRTWTGSPVRSSDVAKLKASIVRGEEAGSYQRMPWA